MKVRLSTSLLLLASLLIVGCGPKSDAPMKPVDEETTNKPSVGSTPIPPDPTKPPANMVVKDVKIPKPGTENWAKPPQQDWKLLAVKADAALKSVKNVVMDTVLAVKGPEMEGQMASLAHIQDSKHFRIEYHDAAKPTDTKVILANGGRVWTFGKDGLEELTPNPIRVEASLTEWRKNFAGWVAQAIPTGRPLFVPLFDVLFNPSGLFRSQYEVKTVQVNGQPRNLYRVVATAKSDPETLWEFRFDSARSLPLTIKYVGKPKGPDANEIVWNARWQFSAPVDKKTFADVKP
jgi:hypothetical protein